MAGSGGEAAGAAPTVALLVARSRPGNIIGRGNRLPWHLRSDLRRFRALTMGHPIVMGRKTYESIGRPLPGRLNIVVSRSARGEAPRTGDGPHPAPSLEAALAVAKADATAGGRDQIFVIGGAEIFRQVLEAGLVRRVYLTNVEAPNIDGDAIFDEPFPASAWTVVYSEVVPAGDGDEFPSQFQIVERVASGARERSHRGAA